MELKLGKMKLNELAAWFGVSSGTMRNNKAKKLEVLKSFADFYIDDKGSVIITDIHIAQYSKAYDVIKNKLPTTWHSNGLDTCARVGSEIYYKYKEVNGQVKLETAKSYANRAKVEYYGHNYLADRGSRGSSEYVWCRIKGEDCVPLTEEEQQIVRDCSAEAYSGVSEHIVLLHDAFHKGEISKSELEVGLGKTIELRQDCLFNFYKLIEERLGFMPERVTRIYEDFNN